ncbi:hypothetical protein F5Y16DRAFT_393981 [Xylariaceae sp. FL0255]|nr:hypothetical protein F5Y16DRAFT_393981 [Xylariaceae sp. FL0255]
MAQSPSNGSFKTALESQHDDDDWTEVKKEECSSACNTPKPGNQGTASHEAISAMSTNESTNVALPDAAKGPKTKLTYDCAVPLTTAQASKVDQAEFRLIQPTQNAQAQGNDTQTTQSCADTHASAGKHHRSDTQASIATTCSTNSRPFSFALPSQPMPIPNAVPRTRVLTRGADGQLWVNCARAPITLTEYYDYQGQIRELGIQDEDFQSSQRRMRRAYAGRPGPAVVHNRINPAQAAAASTEAGKTSKIKHRAQRSITKIKDMLISGREFVKNLSQPSSSTASAETVVHQRRSCLRANGTQIGAPELIAGVASLMETLDVVREDGMEDNEMEKGKSVLPPRSNNEMRAFLETILEEMD